jgi:predicted nucleic acid-binding Zn ribbon protein
VLFQIGFLLFFYYCILASARPAPPHRSLAATAPQCKIVLNSSVQREECAFLCLFFLFVVLELVVVVLAFLEGV